MNWLSKNYDKVALGIAAVVAVSVGYSVFSEKVEVAPPKPADPNNTVEISQREILTLAQERLAAEFQIGSKEADGIEVKSFVSFPLYSIKGKEGILALTDDYEIHPGMPLKWWKKYKLNDYSFKDGPELDSDKDGFNNREEFDGKTDPTDLKSHPNFIAKLKCNSAKGIPYTMNWTKVSPTTGSFSFNYGKMRFYGELGVGGKFPPKAEDKSLIDRFEIMEQGQDPEIAGEDGEYYLLQDNGENQNKKQFKLYYRNRKEMTDWSATFSLGIDGTRPFDVPEGGMFSLPFDDKAKTKPYKFKSKKENKAEIEYEEDGKKLTIELDIPAEK